MSITRPRYCLRWLGACLVIGLSACSEPEPPTFDDFDLDALGRSEEAAKNTGADADATQKAGARAGTAGTSPDATRDFSRINTEQSWQALTHIRGLSIELNLDGDVEASLNALMKRLLAARQQLHFSSEAKPDTLWLVYRNYDYKEMLVDVTLGYPSDWLQHSEISLQNTRIENGPYLRYQGISNSGVLAAWAEYPAPWEMRYLSDFERFHVSSDSAALPSQREVAIGLPLDKGQEFGDP